MAKVASITSAPSYHKRFAPSSQADWTTLTFARTRSDAAYVELEQSPAVYWGKDLLNGVLAVFSIGSAVAVLMVVL